MKSSIYLILITVFVFTVGQTRKVAAQTENQSTVVDSRVSEPERIILNPLETAATGVAVTWQMPLSVSENFVQWGKTVKNPVWETDDFNETTTVARVDTVSYEDETSIVKSFRAELSGLEPGESYMYRVGSDETAWSEWLQFNLPESDPDSLFKFIYMGDAQNDVFSQWSRTLREAYKTAPDASFIYYAGDLVNRGYNEEEWNDWFRSGEFIHRMIPSIMTPGNHEYDDLGLTPLWQTHFSLPHNGPKQSEDLKGATYFVDYPAVRIISIDGTTSEDNQYYRDIQAKWLEEVLKNTEQEWIVLTLHQPFFSTKETRDNPQIRDAYRSLLEDYGVDMVLQGHDHAYGRGMLPNSSNAPGKTGTMYVVSVSGPKMYDIGEEKSWMQKKLADTQLFQVITIHGEELNFKSYTTTGELFDEFILQKSSGDTRLIE